MWGEPITRGDAIGPDFMSPVASSRVTDDPLRAEVSRLRVPVSQPQRDVMVAGERVPLTPGQFDEYQRLAGTGASRALHDAIRSPQWQLMTDAQRSEFIRSAFSDARRGARGQLMVDHSEIGGGASGGLPPLPPGSSVGGGQSRPASKRDQQSPALPASALPPLPRGYVLHR